METQMLALFILCTAALTGYCHASVIAWPVAALSLALASWREHYFLARRGVDLGLRDAIGDTLLKSSANAFVATGVCYWSGALIRGLSGL